MTETYTSGAWIVKAGEEEDFVEAWKELPEFPERIGRVRAHCEDFQPSTHELVTIVS